MDLEVWPFKKRPKAIIEQAIDDLPDEQFLLRLANALDAAVYNEIGIMTMEKRCAEYISLRIRRIGRQLSGETV